MKTAMIILIATIVDILLWMGVIYISINSHFDFEIKVFSAGFGCAMVCVLVGIVTEKTIVKNKPRHATRIL